MKLEGSLEGVWKEYTGRGQRPVGRCMPFFRDRSQFGWSRASEEGIRRTFTKGQRARRVGRVRPQTRVEFYSE